MMMKTPIKYPAIFVNITGSSVYMYLFCDLTIMMKTPIKYPAIFVNITGSNIFF